MGLFKWLFGTSDQSTTSTTDINPATGLPMTNGIGGVDVGGNPYGVDLDDNDAIGINTNDLNGNGIDDMFDSSTSSFDDPFNDFS